MTQNVLLLDADTSYHIDLARGLAVNGVHVHAADTGADFPFSKYSRYTESYNIVGVPDPATYIAAEEFFGGPYFGYTAVDEYIEQLESVIERREIDVLLPFREEHAIVLSAISDELEANTGVRLALPDHDDMIDAADKSHTFRRADQAGLSIPRSYYPSDKEDVREIFEQEPPPIIAKPSFGRGARGVQHCHTVQEGIDAFGEISVFSQPVFQEKVTGTKYVACAIGDKHKETIASFIAQVHFMSSPSGGGSICSRSCKQATVREELLGLMEAFDWIGPATPEYIVDQETGEAKLMEINPRMFGHTTIAIRSGVNVPYLFYKVAMEEPVEPVHSYREDLMWFNPAAMIRTGNMWKLPIRETLRRVLTRKIYQVNYPITDPVYAGLKLGWDLKQALIDDITFDTR